MNNQRIIKYLLKTKRLLNYLKQGFHFFVTIVIVFSFTSCRDEFTPDLKSHEELLVVDALISDEPGPYIVTLMKASEINNRTVKPFTGCTVKMFENTGEIEVFTEVSPGVYQSSTTGISTEVNKSYKLSIETPGGKHYSSEFIEMKPKVEIAEVRAELQYRENLDYPYPIAGYQFYISSEGSDNDFNILWRMEETYEYTSDFSIDYIYRGMGIEEFTNTDTLLRCWKTQRVSDFFVETTRSLTSYQITDKPLHYINTETKKLQVRYSLLAKQYHINDEAYTYWKNIKEQISSDDFLFSSQPYQIPGNIKNEDDPDERVLGFFTVASVSKRRAFFDRPSNVAFHYHKCVPNTDLRGLGFMGPDQFPVYLTNTPQGIALGSEFCFDCTLWGGVLNKPDFWDTAVKDNRYAE